MRVLLCAVVTTKNVCNSACGVSVRVGVLMLSGSGEVLMPLAVPGRPADGVQ